VHSQPSELVEDAPSKDEIKLPVLWDCQPEQYMEARQIRLHVSWALAIVTEYDRIGIL